MTVNLPSMAAGSLLLPFTLGVGPPSSLQAVSDTVGNTYHPLKSTTNTQIWFAVNGSNTGANVITCNFNGAVSLGVMGVAEYTGIFGGNPIELCTALSDVPSGTSWTGNTANTSRPNDLVLAWGYTSAATVTPGGGFTQRYAPGVTVSLYLMDQNAVAPGSYTPTATWAVTAEMALYTVAIASVAPAGGGGGLGGHSNEFDFKF